MAETENQNTQTGQSGQSDPNPARTQSDSAEAQKAATEKQAAADKKKAENSERMKKLNADKAAKKALADQLKNAEQTAAANLNQAPDAGKKALVVSLMDTHSVNELHENSKGEFFTKLDLAIHSEGGKSALVKTHTRSITD